MARSNNPIDTKMKTKLFQTNRTSVPATLNRFEENHVNDEAKIDSIDTPEGASLNPVDARPATA